MYQAPVITIPQPIYPSHAVVSGPASLSIDLDTVKTFINRPLEDTFWDDETTSLIKIAEKAIEAKAQICLSATKWVATLPAFFDRILIKKRPFVSVDKIEYVDPATGTITTVDPTIYMALPALQLCGMVYRGDGAAWPSIPVRQDAVRITYNAGFGSDPNPTLPDDIAHCILMTVAALDRNRGEQLSQGGRQTVYAMKNTRAPSIIPTEAQALLAPYILRSI